MKRYVLLMLMSLTCVDVWAQTPQGLNGKPFYGAGEKFPDFTFDDIHNYESKKVSLSDFKGKWLILDYWSQFCSGCIKSMPKMSKLQEEFKDRVQIIMVGYRGDRPKSDDKDMKDLYEKLEKASDLDLTVAYDTVLGNQLSVELLPDILIVDPNGIIRGRTSSINSKIIQDFLVGKNPSLEIGDYEVRRLEQGNSYTNEKPLLINNNGGSEIDFTYRSIFTYENHSIPPKVISANGRFELLNVDLGSIYKLVHFGTAEFPNPNYDNEVDKQLYENVSQKIIYNITDTSWFSDVNGYKKKYCYSLMYPKEDTYIDPLFIASRIKMRERVQSNLKNDLENYFPYTSTLEKRQVKCFKLVATEKGKAYLLDSERNTNNMMPSQIERKMGITIGNRVPFQYLLADIHSKIGYPKHVPIFNDTGVLENISFFF